MGSRDAGGWRDYGVVTAAYWAFTLSDGALRMLVLLHLWRLGYAPLEIASYLLLYELCGVVTNLFGGWLGARLGLRTLLLAGLALQAGAFGWLAAAAGGLSLGVLVATQAASGVAKDLVKTGAKSWVKLVLPEDDRRGLLRLVAWLTGSKNALKGAGFFVGGALLEGVGFAAACGGLAALVAAAGVAAGGLLPRASGRSARPPRLADVVGGDARVRWLSAARLFLFGSRDAWFALALPLFLAAELGWSQARVGGFLALWVVGYGALQAAAPYTTARRGHDGAEPDARWLLGWTAALALPLVWLLGVLSADPHRAPLLVGGLALFALVFAAGSALHSTLIVAYAERDRVSLRVGAYYSANAAGRLVGTALSGGLYQVAGGGPAGLAACLVASLALVAASSVACVPLRRADASQDGLPRRPSSGGLTG